MENVVAKPVAPGPPVSVAEVPFGVNEVRLNRRQWLASFLIVSAAVILVPRVWERIERFETGPDYRIPYALSADYWLHGRRLRHESAKVIVLGDSVVWGEYVRRDGTLSHFLNRQAGSSNLFVNCGINGLFPLALEGEIRHYGASLRHRRVIVHCNLLWMTSPKADLSTEKEEQFNHSRLVPQFFPRIPCYRADSNERLTAMIERNVSFLGWVNHLQNSYYGQKSIPKWTLQEDGADPTRYPHACENPFAPITLTVPSEPAEDAERGPSSPRHRPWSTNVVGTTHFDWVELDKSLQWAAFQRMIKILQERGNSVLVVVGPFNEHIMAPESRLAYQRLRDGVSAWLTQIRLPHLVPQTLPSLLYADASHPLTDGYALLAEQLFASSQFQEWLK